MQRQSRLGLRGPGTRLGAGTQATPGSHGSGSAAWLRPAAPRTLTLPAEGRAVRGQQGPTATARSGRGRRSRSLAPHLPHLPARPGSTASFAGSGRQQRAGRGSPAKPRSVGRPATSGGRLARRRRAQLNRQRRRADGARAHRLRARPGPSPAARSRTDGGRGAGLPVTCGRAAGEAAEGLCSGPLFAPC